jgi:hypothetical protein
METIYVVYVISVVLSGLMILAHQHMVEDSVVKSFVKLGTVPTETTVAIYLATATAVIMITPVMNLVFVVKGIMHVFDK